ncbi:MAG: glucose-6-phosphate isomerase [Micrococcales bacterium]|nr:glucose-6-phosphate isomerase [Micrococcales bacterium]
MLNTSFPETLLTELLPYREALVRDKVASRIAEKDFTLWGKPAESESSIRLGWVNSAIDSQTLVQSILELKNTLNQQGVSRIVLCGMGGSSLAPEVITKTFGVALEVLDSTDPAQVRKVVETDIEKTAVVVSSKSGSTVETDSQKRVFEQAFDRAGIDRTQRIIIVTDPGSPMEEAAKAEGYRIFNADPNVGGRYSALTAFGMVPSGLAGVDILSILEDAEEASVYLSQDEVDNEAIILGAAMARAASNSGFKDKIGIISDPTSLPDFADWAEQLIAESTGKDEKGILPVVLQQESFEVTATPDDLLLVAVSAEEQFEANVEILVSGSLGAQFLLWEYATAIASRLLELNPFDQPDVESAKVAARGMLAEKGKAVPVQFTDGNIGVNAVGLDLSGISTVSEALSLLLGKLGERSYVAIHAYLDRIAGLNASEFREVVAGATSRPTTFGWGPRFLHSTGQYHKGGPRNGVFLQLLTKEAQDLAVPGREFTFGELISSQAAGDAKVLADLGRPVLTLTLANPEKDFEEIMKMMG